MDPVVYFLIVFNVRENKLEHTDEFSDVEEALERYAAAEDQYLGQGYEVVLVGAESIETVMITHGAYFQEQRSSAPRAGLTYSLS